MNKKVSGLFLAIFILISLLAACGDNTATSISTKTSSQPVTSAATTNTVANPPTTLATTIPTTSAAATTTVAITTAVPTTVATSQANPVTSGSINTGLVELALPAIPGFTRFDMTPQLLDLLRQESQKSSSSSNNELNPLDHPKAVSFLGTELTDIDTAGSNINKVIKDAGYTFAIPGYNTLLKLGKDNVLGVYSKSGNLDLFTIGFSSQSILANATKNNTSDKIPTELINFIKNKKYVFYIIGADGLVALYNKDSLPPNLPTIGK